MDIARYLKRIHYEGLLEPNVETLRALHRAHMLSVPFENLDIPLGRPIALDEARLFRKIVEQRRGGFCYELNGAFAALLHGLGYDVSLLAARVFNAQGELGIEFDHLTLMVTLDERWLADVGFGDSFTEPLRLDERAAQMRAGHAYRIADHGADLAMQELENGEWQSRYLFTLQPYALEDFAGGCHFHQTSPDSPFTRRRVCTRATPDGRITLSDMKLIITQNGTKRERLLNSEAEYAAALHDYFDMALNAPPAATLYGSPI